MNNNYENLPAVLNANQLAAALGISRAGAYQLLNTGTFPTLRIGKRLLVPKDKLIARRKRSGKNWRKCCWVVSAPQTSGWSSAGSVLFPGRSWQCCLPPC